MVGIVIAMPIEFDNIVPKVFKNISQQSGKYKVYLGNYENTPVSIIVSGVGKVKAASATQYLIDKYNPDRIINVGVCGASKAVADRPAVCIDSAVELDYNTSGIDNDFDPNSVAVHNPQHKMGSYNILYTADHFTTGKPELCGYQIEGYFDMEGYAVASTAMNNELVVTVIKSATDIIDTDNQAEQYQNSMEIACNRAVEILKEIL